MGYPEDSNKASVRQGSGRSQSQRTPRRIARQFAPAGWTMCECEADKEWILCERTEAVAAELAEQFQKHLMQDAQEALMTSNLSHDKEDLPDILDSAKEATMARYQLQLEEEERSALRECNQLEDNRDRDENTNILNKRPSTAAKKKLVSKQLRSSIGEANLNGNTGKQAMEEVSARDEENDCAQNKALETSTEESIRCITAKNRNSSRRRRAEVRGGSEHAESGRDGAALKNHKTDLFDTPSSRKLSRAERRAANAQELATQDQLLQQVQDQGKVDETDSQIQSHESPMCAKSRAKNRKSK